MQVDLFAPVKIGEVELKNRIVMSPMTRARCGMDGVPGGLQALFYAPTASAGLISLTRVAALDLAPDHVTCNALALLDTGENGLHAPTPAKVISWLCTDAAVDVSGQLFGVRGREVLLFSPPQPVARLADATDWSIDQFSQAALAGIAGRSSALDAGTPALDHAPPA